jgi:membrane-associated phospholipid phosphatase
MLTNTKPGLIALLLIVFCINVGETWVSTSSRGESPVSPTEYKTAFAVQRFEREVVNFEFHDKTARWAMYASSFSYFMLFPIVAATVLFALARRHELAPFRVLCLAVATDYFVSLFCFLVFPVPERWAYPESNAILLSDQWTSNLIEFIRPISALNNCFPSTHVSLTVILLIVCWRFDVRFRHSITALLLTVIFSTFLLGIHWLADITAGIFVGGLSVAMALRWTDTSERRELVLESA